MPVRAQQMSSFLGSLTPRVRKKLLAMAETFSFSAGQVIFRQDDPSLYIYVIQSGGVAVEVHVPRRGSKTILTVGPGDLFSWSALIEPRIETATARATEPTVVLGIRGGALMDLCREDCRFGFEIYHALACVISTRLMATRLQMLDVFATS